MNTSQIIIIRPSDRYKAMSDFDLDAEKHSPASSVQSTKRLRS